MGNEKIIGELLQAHGFRKTTIRMEILDIFMNHVFALSANDIIARLKVSNDRATVYRALSSFEEHGIIHKAAEYGQGVKYALCSFNDFNETIDNQHAHFICDKCQKTYCLKEIVIPEIQVSKEYSVNRVNYTLYGTCKECKTLN